MKKLFFLMTLLLSTATVFAQNVGVEMADKMRSEGKIYVVIVTLAIVFIGIAVYLFAIDRRLKKLEK